MYLFLIVLFDKTWAKELWFLSGSLLRDDWAYELISYGLKQLNSYELKYLRAMGSWNKFQKA
jgi:hypothetical protein